MSGWLIFLLFGKFQSLAKRELVPVFQSSAQLLYKNNKLTLTARSNSAESLSARMASKSTKLATRHSHLYITWNVLEIR